MFATRLRKPSENPMTCFHAHEAPPGVCVERRAVLHWAGLAGALALMPGTSAASGRLTSDRWTQDAEDAFGEFVAFWKELGETHLDGEHAREGAYVHRLAGRMATLGHESFPKMQRAVFESEAFRSGPTFFDGRIFVIELRVEPGAVIKPHNHPGFDVVTLLIEGSASFAHFEPLEELPEPTDFDTPFEVRKTRSGFLLPGRMTHLTQNRDNMHTFRAGPEGATLLDFNTRLGGPDFGLFRYEEQASEPFEGIHEAHWIEKVF